MSLYEADEGDGTGSLWDVFGGGHVEYEQLHEQWERLHVASDDV